MSLTITVTYDSFLPKIAKRQFNNILKLAYAALGVLWHRRYRLKHFTKGGATEYRYAPRSGDPGRLFGEFKRSYQGKKLSQKGHTRPMEWSGQSKRLSAMRNIVSTSKGASVKLPGLRNFNRYRPGGKEGDPILLFDEVTRVSPREVKQLRLELRILVAAGLSKKTGVRVFAFRSAA